MKSSTEDHEVTSDRDALESGEELSESVEESSRKKEDIEGYESGGEEGDLLTESTDQETGETQPHKDEEELNRYKQLSNEYLIQLQRLQAEFDNFRKREERQRLELKKVITENYTVDLLPVIDNFERALSALQNDNTTLESFAEGIKMVFQQLEKVLDGKTIKRMNVLGEYFDPKQHEAVSKIPSQEYEEDHVMQVLQNGWSMGDKVIRPAMVIVSAGGLSKDTQDLSHPEEAADKKE